MTPKDKNILDTLNLLTLLFDARKKFPNLPVEEKHVLIVKKEHLEGANITIPVFLNTLKDLNQKGYLMGTGIYEQEYHDKVRETFADENYSQILKDLSKVNAGLLNDEQKEIIAKEMERMIPPGHEVDREAIKNTDISYQEMLDSVRPYVIDHKDDHIAVIALMPFRDIGELLKKMNEGKSFDEIQDSGIWYDPVKYEFHIGNDVISTSYQDKPNVEHSVLAQLHENLDDGIIGYEDVSEHSPASLKQALLRFIEKDSRLKDIFSVHSSYLKVNKEYLD